MGKINTRQGSGHSFGDVNIGNYIDASTLAEIKKFATEPTTLDEKLELFARLSTNHEVVFPGGRKDYRSRLGSFVNRLFNSEMVLPTTGRRQQIGLAIRYAQEYLQENPEVSIYYATTMGAAKEFREWQVLVGDLKPEQQIAIMNQPE